MSESIYLDCQATTPMAPEVFAAMEPWLKDQFWNPHSAHTGGRKAAAAVEAAREQVATLLPAGGRVIFTSGATEALNLAIKGCGLPVSALATEHAAVLDCVEQVGGETLSVGHDGICETQYWENGLAACMLVNNEIGTIQPIVDISDAVHDAGGLLLCDAVQGFGRLVLPDGPDMIAVSAHKIHGPKGIGALWVRDGIVLDPLMHGGGQEQGLRSGTLSPALCVGFGAAARLAAERMADDWAHVEALWTRANELFADWTINGSERFRYKGNLNIRRDGVDVARLMSECREVMFSAGSACASGSGRPSHVLRAIGLTEQQAKSSIRLGWGRYTTVEEIERAASLINAAVERQFA
ncbi:MAG: cysteine desulfurase family protein [Sphingorhabdus sp.]|uniref:cysteine desulfurase family protein n=1 Tax=Sphingorhabdus sp. TaxID=1902408 RepID=UPI003C873747